MSSWKSWNGFLSAAPKCNICTLRFFQNPGRETSTIDYRNRPLQASNSATVRALLKLSSSKVNLYTNTNRLSVMCDRSCNGMWMEIISNSLTDSLTAGKWVYLLYEFKHCSAIWKSTGTLRPSSFCCEYNPKLCFSRLHQNSGVTGPLKLPTSFKMETSLASVEDSGVINEATYKPMMLKTIM